MNAVRLTMCLCLGVTGVMLGCDKPPAKPATPGNIPPPKPTLSATGCNVLLITMDTTRADRLGCYGWQRAVTPNLDALAGSGVRFERAYCQVPITLPSHGVILTGAYPPEIGLRVNGQGVLPEEVPTLAELFREHGYRTGAWVASAVLHKRYGLNRGFEVYADAMEATEQNPVPSQIPAQTVCDRALAWLDQVADQPFFGWVHFYDPHTPYFAPQEFAARTGDPYDAEVAYMDSQIGRLLGWLEQRGLRDKTLLVAVADHGESLGEHGYQWHSLLLYESILRVPLIFSLPGRLAPGHVHPGVVRLVDLVPTICEMMGWPASQLARGESLAPALAGAPLPDRVSYGETEYPYESFGWSPLRSIVDGRWKYIHGPDPELYDVLNDPGEQTNLFARQPDVGHRLAKALAALEAELTPRDASHAELDAAARRELESLGYVGGGAPASAPSENLRNPREMAWLVHEFRRAEGLIQVGRAMEAVEVLESAVAQSPESFVLNLRLGTAYGAAGRLEDAQRMLTQALQINPESADAHAELALALGLRGRFSRALAEIRKALMIEPDHEMATRNLRWAQTNAEQQRRELANLRQQWRAAEADPELALRLADRLDFAGETREAVTVLQAAFQAHRDDPRLANALAWLLATAPQPELRNGTEALRLARLACGASPSPPADYLATLAAACAEAGRLDEAAELAEKAEQQARATGNTRLAERIARCRACYTDGRAYHQMP